MSARVRFRPEAAQEVTAVRQWYDLQRPGLGEQFAAEVERVVDLISRNPLVFPAIHGLVRRAMIRRFPYGLYYRASATEILVVACYHHRRRPRRWGRRPR